MRTVFSRMDGWELVNATQDLRGERVVDEAGRERGLVRDLVVDTDAQRVTAVLLEDGTELPLGPLVRRGGALVTASTTPSTTPAYDESRVVVPIAQERIAIAKRTVPFETVRVQSHIVESPREAEVTLREEEVHVERRPANRAVQAGDVRGDRTVEVMAIKEVPVVEKEARVVGEVTIAKGSEQRHETVRETVRRTDVRVTPSGGPKLPQNRQSRPTRGGPPASR